MRKALIGALTVLLTVGLLGVATGAERTKSEPDVERKKTAVAEHARGDVMRMMSTGGGIDHIGDATLRVWGNNRYRTAAEVSRMMWEWEDTYVVFLATGENFPDALSMGPSTWYMGPLLLARRNSLPEPTRQELERLEPCLIIAVGGSGAISDAVLEQADAYTADPELCF